MPLIYIVEDDENIRELVVYTLNSTGLSARGFASPSSFREAMKSDLPSLVMLDIMLPEEDGLSLLAWLRSDPKTKSLPVIMLTARGSEYDKVRGLESGADDYIPKPFGTMELVARVKALLRRVSPADEKKEIEYRVGELCVSPAAHSVRVNGTEVQLTPKEYETLLLFLENKNIVLSRDQILNNVWGYSYCGESRTVDVHIRSLRKKLGVAGDMIETIRGVGYRLRETARVRNGTDSEQDLD
jgi:two-component system alkaline phosphatase synthesis response regulator PhoP